MKFNIFQNGGTVEGRVNIDGLTLVGPLKLLGEATEPLHAVNKEYVDSKINNLDASKITSGFMPVSRMPGLTGDFISLSGTGVISLKNSGVTPGTYTKVTVNAGGLVTDGGSLSVDDIPSLGWEKIGSGKPTTLAGYGIVDAVSKDVGVVNGNITLAGDPVDPTDVATKRYVDQNASTGTGFAIGDVISYESEITPSGFLRANGGEVSKTTYADLYAVIGDTFAFVVNNQMPGNGKPWKQQYEINTEQSTDITGWTTGTSLPGALSYSQAIVTKNRVYLLGGFINGGAAVSTVYTAPINADGTLGAWATGASLPGALESSQAIVTKNRVYLLGGSNGSTYTSTVYTAPINADGTLGAWATGASLPGGLGTSQAIVTKNRVYLLGGYNGSGAVSTVYTAPINEDGTLGTWTTGTSLPGALYYSQAIVTKNRVYLLGGTGASSVYTAPINTDGTLGVWATGANLPVVLGESQAIVTKNRVYLSGGSNISTVYTAPINTDGTLGTWAIGTALPGKLGDSQAIVTKNRVYLLGGWNGNIIVSTVYTAPILGGLNDYSSYYDGTITPLDPSSTTFRLPDYTTVTNPIGKYYVKY